MFTSVVLPLPLSPMTPRHSPGMRSKVASFTAWTSSLPWSLKVLVRSLTDRIGSAMVCASPLQPRHGGHQRFGIGRLGMVQNLVGLAVLHGAAFCMTRTLSAMAPTTPMLCVTMMMLTPNSLRMSIISSTTCFCTCTSSALVGSSAMRTPGAGASPTRCRRAAACRRRARRGSSSERAADRESRFC